MAVWLSSDTNTYPSAFYKAHEEARMKDDGVRPTVDYREETVGKITLFTQQHIEGYRVAVLVDGVVVYTTQAYETGEEARKKASEKVSRGFQRLISDYNTVLPDDELPF